MSPACKQREKRIKRKGLSDSTDYNTSRTQVGYKQGARGREGEIDDTMKNIYSDYGS